MIENGKLLAFFISQLYQGYKLKMHMCGHFLPQELI